MISPESFRPELGRHAKAGATSNRRLSSVTRTVISLERGLPAFREGRAPSASVAALAANPAAENLRKSRLVRCVGILPPTSQDLVRRCIDSAGIPLIQPDSGSTARSWPYRVTEPVMRD